MRPNLSPSLTTDLIENQPFRSPALVLDAGVTAKHWLKVEVGLSARRIYQDLVEQNGFRESYQSVQRFVRKLKRLEPQRIRRMEARPGKKCRWTSG
jgi:hypothetical protein